jgi:hypothetical protein
MPRKSLIALLLLSACAQQGNGNDIRLQSPGLFSPQPWGVKEQSKAADGTRICTVSAGEVEVTQKSQGKTMANQVATTFPLVPGESYEILVNGHMYETYDNWFRPNDSQAIISDFMQDSVLYTEWHTLTMHRFHPSILSSMNNKIGLEGFAEQYKACTQFVKKKTKG